MKLFLALMVFTGVSSFHRLPTFTRHRPYASSFLQSSNMGGSLPPNDGGKGQGEPMGDFLNGFGKQESENMQNVRDYLSDQSLPISFDANGRSEEFDTPQNTSESIHQEASLQEQSDRGLGELSFSPGSALQRQDNFFETPNEDLLRNNPYIKVVSSLSPSELISKFTKTSSPRVQNAVRSTILGLIGSLPKMAFETTTITTGQRLASLMFQLQMTGYLFKNAEYRLSLAQSLGSLSQTPTMGSGTQLFLPGVDDHDEDDDDLVDPLKGKVKGKLKIKYGVETDPSKMEDKSSSTSFELEVDAAAYMSELRTEVSQLRDELILRRKEKEEAIRKDLLLFIRTLPEQQLRELTGTISQEVLVAMKGLVNVVMAGIGEGEITADTITEQSGEAMAQLCMWQLVVGYNLRELEVREEMKNSLFGSPTPSSTDGVNFSEPGAFD